MSKIIKKSLLLLAGLFLTVSGFAQSSVSGRVNDENGESLIGASVMIAGTRSGTGTDIEGN